MTTKTCRSCDIGKPVDEFYREPNSKDGRQASCKACVLRRSRERYHDKKPEDWQDHRRRTPDAVFNACEDCVTCDAASRCAVATACTTCGVEKTLDQFYLSDAGRFGRYGRCITCMREINNERYHRRKAGDLTDRRPRRPLPPPGFGYCSDCGKVKPASDFAASTTRRGGLFVYCRPCNSARAYASVKNVHGSGRNRHLKMRYGLTEGQVDAMVAAQGGMCAICRTRPAEHVDHDHMTSMVRGVLCFTCNVGLGTFGDEEVRLRLAAGYLEGDPRRHVEPGDVVAVPLPLSKEGGGGELLPRRKAEGAGWDRHVEWRYALTPAEVEAEVRRQGGLCAVCRVRMPEHVDHDHRTGAVRGILCFTCNTGMGNFGDDPERLLAAARYLRAAVLTT
jgi:hypothetical protein